MASSRAVASAKAASSSASAQARVDERVRDQHDRALVMVDGGQIGDQQHLQIGQTEFVGRLLRQRFDAAHHVVGEVADEAAGQRRQAGQPGPFSARHAAPSTASGSPLVGSPAAPRPSSSASPSTTDSVATALTPTNDQRENERPGSADSSRNVPGRSRASLR